VERVQHDEKPYTTETLIEQSRLLVESSRARLAELDEVLDRIEP
jgi:hypothetical protein